MAPIARSVSLAEQVAEQLRLRIASGEFPVGSLIPTEQALTEEFGVSRNSVREALRSLVHAGLLRPRAGYGTTVIATSELAPALVRQIERSQDSDVAEVRLLLEREAARFATTRATAAQRQELREAACARDAATTVPDYVAADLRYHRAVLDASGNALLSELGRGAGGNEQALSALDASTVDLASYRSGDMRELDLLHWRLVEAIEARDAELSASVAERLVVLAHQIDSPQVCT